MSASREEFVRRVAALGRCQKLDAVVSREPGEVHWNYQARLIRNGLVVVTFAALEDFLRTRVGELCLSVSCNALKFSQLPSGVQKAAVTGVMNALPKQHKLASARGADPDSVVREHAKMLASTSSASWKISSFAFLGSQDNVAQETIKEMLSAFGVKDPWSAVAAVARRAGSTSVDLASDFKQLATLRHSAAHSADAETEFSELESVRTTAIKVALGVDGLLTTTVRRWNQGRVEDLAARDVRIRVLSQAGGEKVREFANEEAKKATRIHPSLDSALEAARPTSAKEGSLLVLRDHAGLPINWWVSANSVN